MDVSKSLNTRQKIHVLDSKIEALNQKIASRKGRGNTILPTIIDRIELGQFRRQLEQLLEERARLLFPDEDTDSSRFAQGEEMDGGIHVKDGSHTELPRLRIEKEEGNWVFTLDEVPNSVNRHMNGFGYMKFLNDRSGQHFTPSQVRDSEGPNRQTHNAETDRKTVTRSYDAAIRYLPRRIRTYVVSRFHFGSDCYYE